MSSLLMYALREEGRAWKERGAEGDMEEKLADIRKGFSDFLDI